MSLTFAGEEKASPALKTSVAEIVPPMMKSDNKQECYSSESQLAAAFKPSDVIELQKHVSPTITKQQRRKNSIISDATSIGASQGKFNSSAFLHSMYMYMHECTM